MNLEILEIKELENGGAELIIDMDAETQKYLINKAIIDLMRQGLKEVRELHETQLKKEVKNED